MTANYVLIGIMVVWVGFFGFLGGCEIWKRFKGYEMGQ